VKHAHSYRGWATTTWFLVLVSSLWAQDAANPFVWGFLKTGPSTTFIHPRWADEASERTL